MPLQSKMSKSAVEAAGEKWTQNLKRSTKHRPCIPELKQDMSDKMCKMPFHRDIAGRFLGLFDEVKGEQDRLRKKSVYRLPKPHP